VQKFKKWVYGAGGPTWVGNLLGVSRQTIYYWMKGVKLPSRTHQQMIVDASSGEIAMKDFRA
jgi:DNA-binding transcriptional regulator YdaS (Cro superfamily)